MHWLHGCTRSHCDSKRLIAEGGERDGCGCGSSGARSRRNRDDCNSGALCGRSVCGVCGGLTHLALEPSAFDALGNCQLITAAAAKHADLPHADFDDWSGLLLRGVAHGWLSRMVSSLGEICLRKEDVVGWRWMIQADHTLRRTFQKGTGTPLPRVPLDPLRALTGCLPVTCLVPPAPASQHVAPLSPQISRLAPTKITHWPNQPSDPATRLAKITAHFFPLSVLILLGTCRTAYRRVYTTCRADLCCGAGVGTSVRQL